MTVWWTDIENAPRDGRRLLLGGHSDGLPYWTAGSWSNNRKAFISDAPSYAVLPNVTCWLPAPPMPPIPHDEEPS